MEYSGLNAVLSTIFKKKFGYWTTSISNCNNNSQHKAKNLFLRSKFFKKPQTFLISRNDIGSNYFNPNHSKKYLYPISALFQSLFIEIFPKFAPEKVHRALHSSLLKESQSILSMNTFRVKKVFFCVVRFQQINSCNFYSTTNTI